MEECYIATQDYSRQAPDELDIYEGQLVCVIDDTQQGEYTFSGFSVGSCINEEEGYLLPTSAWKTTGQRFDWMLQSSLEQKWQQLEHSVETSASYFPSLSW